MDELKVFKAKKLSLGLMLKIFLMPMIVYALFIYIRVNQWQPDAESELGDFLTAVNFLFGASVSYFIYTLLNLGFFKLKTGGSMWWFFASCLMLVLAFDEIFMIHENVSAYTGIQEIFVFGFYGAVLCCLLFFKRLSIGRYPIFFLGIFFVASGVAVLGDQLTNTQEGVVMLGGIEIGYEQICEMLAAMSLSCSFVALAIDEFNQFRKTETKAQLA